MASSATEYVIVVASNEDRPAKGEVVEGKGKRGHSKCGMVGVFICK